MPKSMRRSTITNNVWYKNMLVGNDAFLPGAMQLISTQVLTSTASSVSFASIPQGFKHLQLRAVVRTTRASTGDEFRMTYNSITTSSYSMHGLYGNGSSVTSFGFGNSTDVWIGEIPGASASPSETFGPAVLDILDYSSTVKNKTGRSLVGSTSHDRIWLGSQLIRNTAAITSLQFYPGGGAFAIGSRFSLYGIEG
jgi:hypothetical protein